MSQEQSIAALNILDEFKDPRQQVEVKYPLIEIILMALYASICMVDTFIECV